MSNSKLFDVNQNLGKHQHLSDLLDDQVSEQAIDKLLADEKQSEVWFRYNLVRSALKNEQSAYASFDFTQNISAQIAKESSHQVASKPTAQIIPFWKKTGSGFAIAASVAFAMVFSVQMMNSSNEQLNPGTEFATQAPQVLPLVNSAFSSPSELDQSQHEQAQLNDIQRYLNQINQRSLNVNEQLVGGEVMVQSFIVKTKEPVTPFEEKIREMKKPSEANK